MSNLKISDLSFYETDFDSSAQVKGGISSYPFFSLKHYSRLFFPIDVEESEIEVMEETVAQDGSKIEFLRDQETDSSGVVVSQETDTGKAISGILQGNLFGRTYRSSFAASSSFK